MSPPARLGRSVERPHHLPQTVERAFYAPYLPAPKDRYEFAVPLDGNVAIF